MPEEGVGHGEELVDHLGQSPGSQAGEDHHAQQIEGFGPEEGDKGAAELGVGLGGGLGKLVQIVSDAHYTLDYLKVLTPEDLLITVSATGNFATLMGPMVQKVAAYKVLVTVNHAIKMWKSYDQVIYLSEKDNSGARTVYSQYGMTYFFDILYSYYVNKYRETDLLQGPISELPLSDSQKMRVQRCAE